MSVYAYLINVFLVITSTLGLIAVYTQIDAGTLRRLVKSKSLSAVEVSLPRLIYLTAVVAILTMFIGQTHGVANLVARNLFVITLIYSNVLMTGLIDLLILQIIGFVCFLTVAPLSLLTIIAYLIGAVAIFCERWYGKQLVQHKILYLFPSLIIGAFYWTMNYLVVPSVTLTAAVVNLVALVWAQFALIDYDQYQQKDQQVLRRLSHEVQYDGLTQARNWISFQRDLNDEFTGGHGVDHTALIAFDIDHFKEINDTHGHAVGNQALVLLSNQVRTLLDQQEFGGRLYRTGGDEFCIILLNVTLAQATAFSQECGRLIGAQRIHHKRGVARLSGSLGMTMIHPEDTNATTIYQRADKYLYDSKRIGRNRVTVEGQVL
jgi:diguanylate cyclase (GGDEF)-like protein